MSQSRSWSQPAARGFTLIELLIVLAVIGIIIAIAVPGLMGALDRSRQSSSVGLLRTFGTALAVYHTDRGFYPSTMPVDQLMPILAPYQRGLESEDAWYNPLGYESDGRRYTLVCFGKDGVDGTDITPDTRYNYTYDIVYVDGAFTAAPQ